jgi:hypothetical protein
MWAATRPETPVPTIAIFTPEEYVGGRETDDTGISVRQWYGGFPIRTAMVATVFPDELMACLKAAQGSRPVLFTLTFQ